MASPQYQTLTKDNAAAFERTDWSKYSEDSQPVIPSIISTTVANYNNQLFIRRAGCIPFTDFCGKKYYCLGVDRRTSDLTDFGGCACKSDANTIETAFREFNEESLRCFGSFESKNYPNSTVLYDGTMLIVLIKIHIDPRKGANLFKQCVVPNSEISGVRWISSSKLRKLLKSSSESSQSSKSESGSDVQEVIYTKVRNFLRKSLHTIK